MVNWMMTSPHDMLSDSRILLVDDNAINLNVLEDILRKAGHCAIDSCTNPFAVRELYGQQKHDIVLLDIHMPGLSGIEVMAQMKEDYPNEYLPVLVLTADTAPDMRRLALNSGARDFIAKPFDKAEVLLRVSNILLVQWLRKQVVALEEQVAGLKSKQTA
jgi:putative two-component system response regulator